MQTLSSHAELEKLPLHTLKALQTQLKQDLHVLEKVSVCIFTFGYFLHFLLLCSQGNA